MAGNITIIEVTDNYQKVPKDIVFNEDVDALSLGVYVKLLCLGKKWQLSVKGLASTLHFSEDKVRAVFSNLEKAGYLRRKRVQDAGGHFVGWDYEIGNIPLTDIAKTPTSGKTESRKTPTSGKSATINRDNNQKNREVKRNKENNNNPSIISPLFNFRGALIALGVTKEVADAWMQVRKTKKAVNTEIAFRSVQREIEKAGRPADECIRIAVERSWSGFRADWLHDKETSPRPLRKSQDAFDHMMEVGRNLGIVKPREYDEQ